MTMLSPLSISARRAPQALQQRLDASPVCQIGHFGEVERRGAARQQVMREPDAAIISPSPAAELFRHFRLRISDEANISRAAQRVTFNKTEDFRHDPRS